MKLAPKKIDPKKITNEQKSRENLLSWARSVGAEQDLIKIFNRYDDLLKGAKSKEERDAISAFGLVEINQFLTGRKQVNFAVNDLDVANELEKIKEGK